MKEALVSVVMPAYNAEKYIEQAIRSVQNQSYSNWELLICDDCSSDNTTHIIKKYQKKDDRIKLFELKKNSGVTIARNTSLENSIGKYIAFLDSDDYWLKDKLSVQIKFMESKNISFSCTTYGIVRGDEILNKSFFALEELDYKSYMKKLKAGNICYGIVDKLGMYRVTKNSASGNKLKNAKLYFLMLLRVQKIGFFKSVFYELNYMFNAVCKRLIKK
jgi:teichuronic acid biosynthesis glycosyltransferase TuaG